MLFAHGFDALLKHHRGLRKTLGKRSNQSSDTNHPSSLDRRMVTSSHYLIEIKKKKKTSPRIKFNITHPQRKDACQNNQLGERRPSIENKVKDICMFILHIARPFTTSMLISLGSVACNSTCMPVNARYINLMCWLSYVISLQKNKKNNYMFPGMQSFKIVH